MSAPTTEFQIYYEHIGDLTVGQWWWVMLLSGSRTMCMVHRHWEYKWMFRESSEFIPKSVLWPKRSKTISPFYFISGLFPILWCSSKWSILYAKAPARRPDTEHSIVPLLRILESLLTFNSLYRRRFRSHIHWAIFCTKAMHIYTTTSPLCSSGSLRCRGLFHFLKIHCFCFTVLCPTWIHSS